MASWIRFNSRGQSRISKGARHLGRFLSIGGVGGFRNTNLSVPVSVAAGLNARPPTGLRELNCMRVRALALEEPIVSEHPAHSVINKNRDRKVIASHDDGRRTGHSPRRAPAGRRPRRAAAGSHDREESARNGSWKVVGEA